MGLNKFSSWHLYPMIIEQENQKGILSCMTAESPLQPTALAIASNNNKVKHGRYHLFSVNNNMMILWDYCKKDYTKEIKSNIAGNFILSSKFTLEVVVNLARLTYKLMSLG